MPLNILIAEDSATNRLLFFMTLTRLGHTVTLATNGHEALSFFLRHPYDIVFLDLAMPLMNGIETAREIQKNNMQCTPVYAISGYAAPETERLFPEVGIIRCLIKPLDRENLYEVSEESGLGLIAPGADTALPPGLSRKVIEAYMHELWSRGQACPRLLQAGDMRGLAREAHTLGSLACMLNTPKLETVAFQLQACLRDKDDNNLPRAVKRLSADCLRISQELKTHLNRATG